MPTYEIFTTELGNEFIQRFNEDGSTSFIPLDPTNADYQAYLNKDNAVDAQKL
jgi:hypothetical protein